MALCKECTNEFYALAQADDTIMVDVQVLVDNLLESNTVDSDSVAPDAFPDSGASSS